jgi:hypothetical protein
VAVPQGGINWASVSLADFLEYAGAMNPTELLASLRDMRQATGLSFPLVAALTAGMTGPDAAGANITGNPILVGGNNQTGVIKTLLTDSGGILLTIAEGRDDAAGNRVLLTDRTGILSVSPPASKLVGNTAAAASNVGIALTLAAPGANLRNVILGWGFSIAMGATAFAPAQANFSGGLNATGYGASVACPANDARSWAFEGPLLGTANTPQVLAIPAGAAGGFMQAWIAGYVASFP